MNTSAIFGWAPCAVAVIVLMSAMPLIAHAEDGSDIRAAIRSSLLTDPRTSGLSQASLDSIVDMLAQESQKRGLTVEDILWKPADAGSPVQNGAGAHGRGCEPGSFFCQFNAAFGFDDSGSIIPFILGSTSMGMVWILAEVLHKRSRRSLGGSET